MDQQPDFKEEITVKRKKVLDKIMSTPVATINITPNQQPNITPK